MRGGVSAAAGTPEVRLRLYPGPMTLIKEKISYKNSQFPTNRLIEMVEIMAKRSREESDVVFASAYENDDESSKDSFWRTMFAKVKIKSEVRRGDRTREFETLEDLRNVKPGWDELYLTVSMKPMTMYLNVFETWTSVNLSVEQETYDLLMQVAQAAAEEGALPVRSETPAIFLGHGGRSDSWRIVVSELEKHYAVETFESKPRSGLGIQNILKEMLDSSNFAVLVYTGEDEQADTSLRARQNVVHETGLFQGRHGFERVALLVEDGTVSFSNMDGLQYIPYTRGRILDVVPQILEQIAREFPNHA